MTICDLAGMSLGAPQLLRRLARCGAVSVNGGPLPAIGAVVGGRHLSHVPVDDLINGLTDDQIKVHRS